MGTVIDIDGTGFLLNGHPTYQGRSYHGQSISGLLFNSRMVQAIFHDACAETRPHWQYPDTGQWDPDRNTDEFCQMLPVYRSHGLLGVTVGLQGGGAIYSPDVYDRYDNSAYRPDGSFRPAYFDRLKRVLRAADQCGMVVIVNYFYWKHVERIPDDETICEITEKVTDWLLSTGYRNILVDVANEAGEFWNRELFSAGNVHRLLEIVQNTTVRGRRLLAGVSSAGGEAVPSGRWLELEDFSMPHGNGLTPNELKSKIKRLRKTPQYRKRPRPVLINEDSIFVDNLEAAVESYASWGFYCQGYGSRYRDRMDWTKWAREEQFEDLSGFQTPPVNWGINTDRKRRFFEKLREITGGG